MSDENLSSQGASVEVGLEGRGSANLVYILYLVGLVIGISALVGVVLAYINKGKYGAGVDSHLDFQIRTFWLGLVALIAGAVLSIILVGYLIILAWVIWVIIRCITGMQKLGAGEPVSDPKSLGFKA